MCSQAWTGHAPGPQHPQRQYRTTVLYFFALTRAGQLNVRDHVSVFVPGAVVNCFVGMFDIIGFKALRARLGTAGLHQRYVRGIAPTIAHAAAGSGKVAELNGEKMYVPSFTPLSPGFRVISDTVIFFMHDDSSLSFLSIVHSSFSLLQFGFNGSKAPYRGAIGWGDLVHDASDILIGSAVEDAYVGETSQAWAGCMLTEQCRNLANSKNFIRQFREFHVQAAAQWTDEIARRKSIEYGDRLVEYAVDLQQNPKDGPALYFSKNAYVVDWIIRMYEGAAARVACALRTFLVFIHSVRMAHATMLSLDLPEELQRVVLSHHQWLAFELCLDASQLGCIRSVAAAEGGFSGSSLVMRALAFRE